MKNISYNFGAIRDSIARLSSKELMEENKSATLEKYVSKTQLSPDLKKQQLIYKNIQECKPFPKERLAERFLNQNLSMFKDSNWNNMIFENKQLRYELLGAPDVSHVVANNNNGKLFEAINTLIESVTNKGFSDFKSEGEAYEFVLEHLTREVAAEEVSSEKDDAPMLKGAWKFVTKLAVNNFNERYEHLNDGEKEVLSVLLSNNKDKVDYFNSIKKESIELIDSLLEESDKAHHDTLIGFKDKLEKMNNIAPAQMDEHILECIDLKQELNELK
jgi:hypothetical protein